MHMRLQPTRINKLNTAFHLCAHILCIHNKAHLCFKTITFALSMHIVIRTSALVYMNYPHCELLLDTVYMYIC